MRDPRAVPQTLRGMELDYQYPGALDWRPGSELHERIRDRVFSCLQAGHGAMTDRHSQWRKIDEKLTAFVPLNQDDYQAKTDDPRKPTYVVVPVLYATLETVLTYMVAAFLEQDPWFPLEPHGPEDALPVALLEMDLQWQLQHTRSDLALYTMFRDGLAYGCGAVAPVWQTEEGFRMVEAPPSPVDMLLGRRPQKQMQPAVLFEGHAVENVDPYMYIPDPEAPLHDPQKGEFVGWVTRTHRMALLEQEQRGECFNARYIEAIDGRSLLFGPGDDRTRREISDATLVQPVDVAWGYFRLVPAEMGLGDSTRPEIWVFALAGDEVIIKAQPLGLVHNRFPVVTCAPDTDGRAVSPISKLELSYGLQETIDWLFYSHITNVRKAINDTLVYDPSVLNPRDMENPAPGKLVRARQSAFGRDLRGSVFQLGVNDVTRNHINDADFLLNILQRVTGATDIVQGMMREGGERRSATEARGARQSALSRLQTTARLISAQSMRPLGYLLASQTQQLRSEEMTHRITGRWAERLAADFGIIDPFAAIHPNDLLCSYDLIVRDGSVPNADYVESWVQLWQGFSQNPQLALSLGIDLGRVFRHVARLTGTKNVDDFMQMNVQPIVAPDALVEQQVQAGNMVPMEAA